ncbi:hypothetical protein NECAME_08033 [Necator americanus]|uniref:MARVEL domain-containing protein n=1 Tax=Necator americanus TaxID=51031 RepID=W2TMG1_NECAM|nr:hypothetical protein NECAME_08033 [Necator americanus]ETN82321.1 hypothetical protein NECAME_08033 [Necator americanus]
MDWREKARMRISGRFYIILFAASSPPLSNSPPSLSPSRVHEYSEAFYSHGVSESNRWHVFLYKAIYSVPGNCGNDSDPGGTRRMLLTLSKRSTNKQGNLSGVYGQVALIVITLFLALVTVGISCVHLAIGHNLTYAQLFASGIALIAFLVCGGVETWYATGFDHMSFFIMAVGNGVVSGCAGLPGCQIQFVVKGWAVAAAFYFLAGLLYLVDMGLVFAKKDNSDVSEVVMTGTRRLMNDR